jgi:iron(III) transport system ATP-binding protein
MSGNTDRDRDRDHDHDADSITDRSTRPTGGRAEHGHVHGHGHGHGHGDGDDGASVADGDGDGSDRDRQDGTGTGPGPGSGSGSGRADGGTATTAAEGSTTGSDSVGPARASGPGTGSDAASGSGSDSGADTWVDAADDRPTVLELEGVSKAYGGERVIRDLSLSVRQGEILTLLGPSGCGKTTTLRLIAGLERPDAGVVRLNGDPVAAGGEDGFSTPPEERGVGVVFQNFALFPHLTAAENVAFGLREWPDDERAARVDDLLELVGLTAQRDSYPEELSGGQKQRVALARSLAPEPEVLLLDEPFSNLDVGLRERMRDEVRRIIKETGVTAVSVTHDQEEALSISDRVAVVHDGGIEQVGEPEEVFQAPRSRFVAGFLGHASFVPGRVCGDSVQTALGPVGRDRLHGLADEYDETDIDILVRPDDLDARPAEGAGDGVVVGRNYLGPSILYEVELPSGDTVECMHNHDRRVRLDQPVRLSLVAGHELAWFPREQRPDLEAELNPDGPGGSEPDGDRRTDERD